MLLVVHRSWFAFPSNCARPAHRVNVAVASMWPSRRMAFRALLITSF